MMRQLCCILVCLHNGSHDNFPEIKDVASIGSGYDKQV